MNVHQLVDVADAQAGIEAWREDYNQYRPHSALGHLTPIEYVHQRQVRTTAEAASLSLAIVSIWGQRHRPHWWRNALKSFGSFLLLVLATAFVSDDLGEASMLFMLPVFVFPIALGITGLIRFLRAQLAPP